MSLLLVSACSVGEVPPGSGGPTQTTPDAAQTGNGGTDAAPTGGVDAAGGVDSGGGADGTATFDQQVKPIVTSTAYSPTCVGCHAGGIPPNLLSFASLEAKYKVSPGASNILVTHGAHTGPALKAADATTIANWIDSL